MVVQYKPARCAAHVISMKRTLFSMNTAMPSPGARPRARKSCARRFDRSSSSRNVTTSPVEPMMSAAWSGVRRAMAPGYTPGV